MSIEDARRYLSSAIPPARGSDHYFARVALQEAVEAAERHDFGIGAVAVWRRGNRVAEWRAGNRMMSGPGIIDHAETLALLRWCREVPDEMYEATSADDPVEGLSVFGTLEPCPLCACALTNAGAARSVSTIEDGALVPNGGYHHSSGGATVIGAKGLLQPAAWLGIQQGRTRFEVLDLDPPDSELVRVSRALFTHTQSQLDAVLASRLIEPGAVP